MNGTHSRKCLEATFYGNAWVEWGGTSKFAFYYRQVWELEDGSTSVLYLGSVQVTIGGCVQLVSLPTTEVAPTVIQDADRKEGNE